MTFITEYMLRFMTYSIYDMTSINLLKSVIKHRTQVAIELFEHFIKNRSLKENETLMTKNYSNNKC